MRILKGQEILPDDSTLVQHNISDGDTVNVLIEPNHDISVKVQCRSFQYKHDMSHCMTVKQLKMLLIESKEVRFLYKNLCLVMEDRNGDTKRYQVLDDDSIPLHFYMPGRSLNLEAVGPSVLIKSQGPFGQIYYHKITKKSSVNDVMKMIMRSYNAKNVTKISMFVTDGCGGYQQLDEKETAPVSELLPEDKTVYYIEDQSAFTYCWLVYHQGKVVGKVYGNYSGSEYGTVLSIKLRIQAEMGISTDCIAVYRVPCISRRDGESLCHD